MESGKAPKLNDQGFSYKRRELTELDFLVLGPLISKQNPMTKQNDKVPLVTQEVCDEFNFIALEEFHRLSKDGTKIMRFRENETFPIYAFVNKNEEGKEWLKIYMPKGKKSLQADGKDFRFQHLGKKPAQFFYGLDKIRKIYNEGVENSLDEYEEKLAELRDVKGSKVTAADMKRLKDESVFTLKRICIVTGGSDGLNLSALNEMVVFKNSETDHFSKELMEELLKMADDVVNVPDCDQTGKLQGKKLALEHLELKTLWIDDHATGRYQKDMKDFIGNLKSLSYSKLSRKVKNVLDIAKPAKFWETFYNDKSGKASYSFHHTFGEYFLRLNGFCRVDDRSAKDSYYFARITGHIVERVEPLEIKDFFKHFLVQRQKEEGKWKIPFELINSIISSPKLSDDKLASIHIRTLNFDDYDSHAQYFFLSDKIWKVTAAGTEEISRFPNYVMKDQIIDNLIFDEIEHRVNPRFLKIEENQFKLAADGKTFEKDQYGNLIPDKKPYFKVNVTGKDLYDIEILEKDCDILNFLIQCSRVHWDTERKKFNEQGYSDDIFYEKTKFQINGERLSDQENKEQDLHLISFLFSVGYQAHRYKDYSRTWIPYAVDNAVTEDKMAEGGSGKGTFFSIFDFILKKETINGKQDLETDRFWLENVSKETDLVFIDDVRRGFSLEFLYQLSTGKINVNVKNQSKFSIGYKDTPKFAVTSNYSLSDMNGSSIRRRLLIAFSDYYHAKNDSRDERVPKDDFGHQFFKDWDDAQWNKFLNFICQCVSFYLRCEEKIEAPDGSVMKRAWLTQMGDQFLHWADEYFPSRIGVKILKKEAEDHSKRFATEQNYKYLKEMAPKSFKFKTIAWTKYNGYDFEDRIMEKIDVIEDNISRKKTSEFILISEKETVFEELQKELWETAKNLI